MRNFTIEKNLERVLEIGKRPRGCYEVILEGSR